LTSSLGMSVKVPPVRNLRVAEATERLEAEDLRVETEDRSSRDVGRGKVIGSEPPAGDEVECQGVVTLIVSTGANTIAVPDLIDSQQEVAEARIRRLGLIPNVDTRDADEPAGTVIEQDPLAGEQLLRDDEVTIVVSTGAGSVIVPDVVGQSEDSARASLASRGLAVDVVEQDTDDESDDGRVLQQAPTAGTQARSGDQVTIVVGVFVEPEPTTTTTDDTTTPEPTTTTTTQP
jgi:eukaryotic-like serine/threonine-protein kinase